MVTFYRDEQEEREELIDDAWALLAIGRLSDYATGMIDLIREHLTYTDIEKVMALFKNECSLQKEHYYALSCDSEWKQFYNKYVYEPDYEDSSDRDYYYKMDKYA